ncbi:MAG: hypothetical protein K2P94_14365 [Rhodospirillaceae bacterium]|nr:hypothetical protein [Rhodospirillaceae bacterium]
MVVLFAILVPVLGGARDDAQNETRKLTTDIGATTQAVSTAKADHDYVVTNLEKFEALIKSDRLIPHTRRAAVTALGEASTAHGITLNYNFGAAIGANTVKSAESQPKSTAYRVSVESIELRYSASYDGPVYGFVADITQSFPGSAILESFSIARSPSGDILSSLSASGGKLVQGEMRVSWRTAQAQQDNP